MYYSWGIGNCLLQTSAIAYVKLVWLLAGYRSWLRYLLFLEENDESVGWVAPHGLALTG